MNDERVHFQVLWKDSLDIIRERITVSEYNLWIEPLKFISSTGNTLIVSVPTEMAREKFISKYLETIRYAIKKASQGKYPQIDISVVVVPLSQSQEGGSLFRNHVTENIPLNPKYSFSTFVVGNGNKFAHAASYAVAENPARSYNPLFIYGGVGLGKTHLMHAIGIHVTQKNTGSRIEYSTSEKFTNELINSIRDDKTEAFRQKYRSVDILLIDDIQFLAGKERTQEEFFHTFNTLHGAFKQIVLTSDRPPKEIPTLEDRLRSRFEWGLLADIQPPDLETRIAILRKKAELENVAVPDGVITYIANQIPSNIRELEGALVRIKAFCILNQIPLEVDVAKEILKDILPKKKSRKIDVVSIQRAVADHYHLKAAVMRARKRTREIAFPRQVAMYLTRTLTDLSLPSIGEEFGGRDHTTVLHAFEKIKSEMKTNPLLAQEVETLIIRIRTNDSD